MEAIDKQLRKARIAAGLTQAALAAKVGCTQSAVSMMEAGRGEAMSRESLEKLATILGVALPNVPEASPEAVVDASGPAVCPGFNCPTNLPYAVGGDVFFMPLGTAGRGHHCVFCGEPLLRRCPACGAALTTPGGCCGACGAAVVTLPDGYADDPASWVERRQTAIAALRRATETPPGGGGRP